MRVLLHALGLSELSLGETNSASGMGYRKPATRRTDLIPEADRDRLGPVWVVAKPMLARLENPAGLFTLERD